MILVWMWPAFSSAARMRPMRPSIMSEGATMSTPAVGLRQRLLAPATSSVTSLRM